MSRLFAATLLLGLLPACVTHSHATQFNGVPGIRGEAVEYQTTRSYAIQFLFTWGVLGNASKPYTIDQFTKEASARGASRVRITQTDSTTYWYVFPPLSFLFQPVVQTIEGDVEGTGASE
ncbi:MAG: hypothetical protein H6830_06705 [Planctomycetes bacterium]|nr:hypothetical protein [Planctomycetota bacterium]MCB9911274.1 hypothetical protein [Planctomycetota bacterium]MCB9911537.1 hypothetical protein [Planctomycetota bacterium]HPF13863.1 hypothetical protein [Planctomycetota bacterium]HRV80906.1 hypothetical protein [Planctomycetota bacterium]